MSRDETAIENEIQEKGLNAPRLTPTHIDEQIIAERYVRVVEATQDEVPRLTIEQRSLYCLTICVLVLRNGFTIVGKSACASPANFDYDLGKKIARDDARNQIWALEGYALRNKLAA